MYLDFKDEFGMVERNDGQKFWRKKLLVDVQTWNEMLGRTKLDELLKFMPKEFMKMPLPFVFGSFELVRTKYQNWLNDYFYYLVEICNEPPEGLMDRIVKL